MELNKSQEFPSIKNSNPLKTFSHRLARLMLLRIRCEADHPVLIVEMELIEMAKSKLQEFIMTQVSKDSIRLLKPILETWIRVAAQERALSFDEDDYIKEQVLSAILSENVSDVIPTVH